MHGYYRVSAGVIDTKVADVAHNTDEIVKLIEQAESQNSSLIVFSELTLTGYSVGDLFLSDTLNSVTSEALQSLCDSTCNTKIIAVVGASLWKKNRLYNCAVVIQGGAILGVVPKSYLPNYKEFYEKRWFESGKNILNESITVNGKAVPFGIDLLFKYDTYFTFGIEVCEDLWAVIPPSSKQALSGATLFLNLSASNELVGKADYRKTLVSTQSARCVGAYVYASSSVGESSTDTLYGGHALICENGVCVAENERFNDTSHILAADVDLQKLFYIRASETSFADEESELFRTLQLNELNVIDTLTCKADTTPFVPKNKHTLHVRSEEILSIQSHALAKRVKHIGNSKLVIGISGGLDSTLALLVSVGCMKLLGRNPSEIIAITMPGFGTTDVTYTNALELCKALHVELREIDIKPSCLQHFEDIGHDIEIHDVTYENVQARERTQLLMDIANKEGAIVVGTGDLSEMALGWSTYNGDHMSMYGVNSGVPKTLVKHLVKFVADTSDETIKGILYSVIDTPISPELLPHKEGEIVQITEDIIGSYELHDFFLYHFVKYGASPSKILFLASYAFESEYKKEEIKKWLILFFKRFFAMQFKRSCTPDGVKVGTISLSPRADWRMPSDASVAIFLKDLEN